MKEQLEIQMVPAATVLLSLQISARPLLQANPAATEADALVAFVAFLRLSLQEPPGEVFAAQVVALNAAAAQLLAFVREHGAAADAGRPARETSSGP